MEAGAESAMSDGSNSLEDTMKNHQSFAKKLQLEQKKFIKTSQDTDEKLNYLLSQAEHYANYLFNGEYQLSTERSGKRQSRKKRTSRSKDEDDFLDEMSHEKKFFALRVQPSIIKNGELREYQ